MLKFYWLLWNALAALSYYCAWFAYRVCYRHKHSLTFCVTIPLYITVALSLSLSLALSCLPGSKNTQRTNAKAHYMICMHACRWFVFSLCCIFFSLSPFSRSLFRPPSFFCLFSLFFAVAVFFFNLVFLYVIHQQRNGKPN